LRRKAKRIKLMVPLLSNSQIIGKKGIFKSLFKKRIFFDKSVKVLFFICGIFATVIVFFIILFLFLEAYPFFTEVNLWEFLSGTQWDPVGEQPKFGAWPFIYGTLIVTLGALIIAVPLGIGCAIFISQLATPRLKVVLKSAVELLAAIPSVVYGFFGLVILSGWLRMGFELSSGECWLAASILLALMALPLIISISEDAISAVPEDYKEASLAMGATKWQTIKKVIIPSSMSGITAAVILGMGRAIGETMVVMMVAGSSPGLPALLPPEVFEPIMPITAAIGIEMGEASGLHANALFALAIILLIIVLIVNLIANFILAKINEKFHPKPKKSKRWDRIRIKFTISEKKRIMIKYCIFLVLLISISYILFIWFGILVTVLILFGMIAYYYFSKRITSKKSQWVAYTMIITTAIIVLIMLGTIIYYIVSNGVHALSWEFITSSPRSLGREGGIYPAIIGTLYLIGGAITVAFPIGIGAGIYLAEYARERKIIRIIRIGIDTLNGTPSIVFGLFALTFFVIYLDLGISLITGQLVLGFLILPTVIRTTEESIKAIPQSFREGSLALGATKWQTVRKIVLPKSLPGILTGTILSIGRAAGETAPIMFTACVFSQRYAPSSVFEPVMALSNHLFVLITSVPGEKAQINAYGTALVLLLLVMAIYLIAIVIRNHYRKKIQW